MTVAEYALVIGNKNYSSWSLRPWLAMRVFDIPFSEINVDIYTPGKRHRILEHSPSALVPALKIGDQVIWDSLAILETLAERHPDKAMWPEDSDVRALARAVAAEMHSGFSRLRSEMPMDILHVTPADAISKEVGRDIARIVEVWLMCRSQFGKQGDWLFGDFSIADAMYAPVASRFRTFSVNLNEFGDDGVAAQYVECIFAMPEIAEWIEGAKAQFS